VIVSGEPPTGPQFEPDLNSNQITATTLLTTAVSLLEIKSGNSKYGKVFLYQDSNFFISWEVQDEITE
jgi:hypothetical protein